MWPVLVKTYTKFDVTLINLNLKSHLTLMAVILDNTALKKASFFTSPYNPSIFLLIVSKFISQDLKHI